MTLGKSPLATQSWARNQYLISTDASLIPVNELAIILGSDDFYWAKSIPVDYIRQMLDSSLCFGLFDLTSESEKASLLMI